MSGHIRCRAASSQLTSSSKSSSQRYYSKCLIWRNPTTIRSKAWAYYAACTHIISSFAVWAYSLMCMAALRLLTHGFQNCWSIFLRRNRQHTLTHSHISQAIPNAHHTHNTHKGEVLYTLVRRGLGDSKARVREQTRAGLIRIAVGALVSDSLTRLPRSCPILSVHSCQHTHTHENAHISSGVVSTDLHPAGA